MDELKISIILQYSLAENRPALNGILKNRSSPWNSSLVIGRNEDL